MTTTHLALPELTASQSQKHVTHNEALFFLDSIVQLAVLDRDLTGPPGGPSLGDRYIPAATATGDWTGQENDIAVYDGSGWIFLTPKAGWRCFLEDEEIFVYFNGTAWVEGSSKFSGYCNFDNTYAADPTPSWADLLINTEEFDEFNDVAIAANVATFTAPVAGYYQFHIRATMKNIFGTTGNVDRTEVGFSINGSAPNAYHVGSTGFHNFSSRFESVYVTALLSLAAADTVNPQIRVEGAATENIVIGGSENAFWGYRVS